MMTRNDFDKIILPFLDYYWKVTPYTTLLAWTHNPIRIGKMVLFCGKCRVPDALLIVDDNDEPIDGMYITGFYEWKGQDVETLMLEKGLGYYYDEA